jgi:nitroreductase
MEFKDLVTQRRSVHNFEPGFKLSKTQWHELLEYVRYTPSGYNAQPWKFKLIQDEELLKIMHKLCYKQAHILSSGNLVVVVGDVKFGVNEADRIVDEWKQHRNFTDKQAEALHASLVKERAEWKQREMVIRNCSLAAMTFLYAAEDLGLAACPMMGFRQLDLKRELGFAENELPIMLIALGKAGEAELGRLPRKSAKDLEV